MKPHILSTADNQYQCELGVIQKLNDLIFKKWRQIFFEKNPKTQRFEKTQRFDIRDPDYHRIQLLMLKVNSSSPFYGGPDKLSAPRIILLVNSSTLLRN